MKIGCSDFLHELGSLLEGEVDPVLRAHLEAHLAACETCTVLLDSARKTVRIVTETGSFDLPASDIGASTRKIMARIRSAS